jgi:peptidoglycan hydrolase-like protein with peptidoglycan-binding domain
LALGLLLAEEYHDARSRLSAPQYLRSAAKGLGADKVANSMMRMKAQSLIITVQQMLNSSGFSGPVDGVHASRTEAAIRAYCSANHVANCEGTFISYDLLLRLLSETPAG